MSRITNVESYTVIACIFEMNNRVGGHLHIWSRLNANASVVEQAK